MGYSELGASLCMFPLFKKPNGFGEDFHGGELFVLKRELVHVEPQAPVDPSEDISKGFEWC